LWNAPCCQLRFKKLKLSIWHSTPADKIAPT
jgi:hypothetical protein